MTHELLGWLEATAGEILGRITQPEGRIPHGWPTTAQGMGGALRRIAPALRLMGYTIEAPTPTSRPRLWGLSSREGAQISIGNDGNDANSTGDTTESDSGPTIFSSSCATSTEDRRGENTLKDTEKADPDDPVDPDGEKHTSSIDLSGDDILDGIPY